VKAALLVIGAAFELLGIVLVASPDLVPGAVRFARWTSVRSRRIENRVRRDLGLPARGRTVIGVSAGTLAIVGMNASGIVGYNPDAPIEAKVEYLLRRDRAAQEEANRLAQRVSNLEEESATRLDDLRREIEARILREIEAAQLDFRRARIGGTVALALGLGLATAANFV
jgi:hypothetical protein